MKSKSTHSPYKLVGVAAALSAVFVLPLAIEQATGIDSGVVKQAAAASGLAGLAKSGAGETTTGGSSHSSSSHSSGGESSGGHSSGGDDGGHSASGHSSGHASGGGGESGGKKYRWKGLRPDHPGHAAGDHTSQEAKGHQAGKRANSSGTDHAFGGGSGIGGADQVPEGLPASGPTVVSSAESATLEVASTTQATERNRWGYGPQYRYRFRYWGGRNVDDVVDGDGVVDGVVDDHAVVPTTDDSLSVTLLTTPVVGSAGGGTSGSTATAMEAPKRCDDHVGGDMRGWSRFMGNNMGRIDQVLSHYAPQARGGRYMDTAFLVANYQAEMEKTKNDHVLAGTYLGLFAGSGQPITTQTVQEVNFALCVVSDPEEAQEIAAVAEVQRVALVHK